MASWLMHWDCPDCREQNLVKLSVKVKPRTARVFYTCKGCSKEFWYGRVRRYAVNNWAAK